MTDKIKRILILDHPDITQGYARDLGEVVFATDSWHVAEKAYDEQRPDIFVVEPYEIRNFGEPQQRYAQIEQALCHQVPTIVTTTQYWPNGRCPYSGFQEEQFAAFFGKPFDTFKLYAALQRLGTELAEDLKGCIKEFCTEGSIDALTR